MQSRFAAWMFVLSLCVFLGVTPNASAQRQSTAPPPPVRGDPNTPSISNADDAQERLATEMAKKAAKERAAALKIDADKLLKLSVELKQSVDKSDENVLSIDVIKKAEEIEKLARSVKEKMKGPN